MPIRSRASASRGPPGPVVEPLPDRRHGHHRGRARRAGALAERLGLEARLEHGVRAREQRGMQAAETVLVRERQRVQQHLVGIPAPRHHHRADRREHVRVRERDPLRPPGRPGRVGHDRRSGSPRRLERVALGYGRLHGHAGCVRVERQGESGPAALGKLPRAPRPRSPRRPRRQAARRRPERRARPRSRRRPRGTPWRRSGAFRGRRPRARASCGPRSGRGRPGERRERRASRRGAPHAGRAPRGCA